MCDESKNRISLGMGPNPIRQIRDPCRELDSNQIASDGRIRLDPIVPGIGFMDLGTVEKYEACNRKLSSQMAIVLASPLGTIRVDRQH
jgi:hypothetical protein